MDEVAWGAVSALGGGVLGFTGTWLTGRTERKFTSVQAREERIHNSAEVLRADRKAAYANALRSAAELERYFTLIATGLADDADAVRSEQAVAAWDQDRLAAEMVAGDLVRHLLELLDTYVVVVWQLIIGLDEPLDTIGAVAVQAPVTTCKRALAEVMRAEVQDNDLDPLNRVRPEHLQKLEDDAKDHLRRLATVDAARATARMTRDAAERIMSDAGLTQAEQEAQRRVAREQALKELAAKFGGEWGNDGAPDGRSDT